MTRNHRQENSRRARGESASSLEDFAAQYQASYRVLWVVAAGVASPAVATDIVHQAAVHALDKFEQFTPGTNFTAWMAQIVRYVALNHVRAQQHRQALSLDDQGDAPSAAATTQPLELTVDGQLHEDQSHFDDELIQALQSLSPTARACLLLRTVNELSYDEIARTLNIPPGTAMSHVHRSRQQLRRQLGHRQLNPPRTPRPTES